ncbi:MAG: hypothetical protein MHPSP_004620, partial [Paramarteilia canceri]
LSLKYLHEMEMSEAFNNLIKSTSVLNGIFDPENDITEDDLQYKVLEIFSNTMPDKIKQQLHDEIYNI